MTRPVVLLAVLLLSLSQALAQAQEPLPSEPASVTDGLNLIFFVDNKWAMYGAPQGGRLDKAAFEALVSRVKSAKFASALTQVVVILRDSEVEGTLGLIEKRGARVSGHFVEEGGPGPYDIWHLVGHQVLPDKIISDFNENILSAEKIYRDLPILFDGQVKRVAKDGAGHVFVEFMVKQPGAGLVCYPWPEAPQKVDLSSLRSGDRLRVSGQFTDISDSLLQLRGCLFSR